jgi:hypothetical protein
MVSQNKQENHFLGHFSSSAPKSLKVEKPIQFIVDPHFLTNFTSLFPFSETTRKK